MSAIARREAGTLAPLIKCAKCDGQARLIVEGVRPIGELYHLCLDHAIELCRESGDSLGAGIIAGKYAVPL